MRATRVEELFREHAQALYGFLVYRTGEAGLAEEVLSDTFERALRSRRSFSARRGSETTWLYSIALNRLRDIKRRARTERRVMERVGAEDESRHPGSSFEDFIAERSELREAMQHLSSEEREALALRYGGDLSVREIARLLGEPESRVEGRVYRGLRKLRERLLEQETD